MWKKLLESLLLLMAIAFLVPIPPSDTSPVSPFPAAAFAATCFLASRWLRHHNEPAWRTALIAGAETLVFMLLASFINLAANILLRTHG